MKKIISVTLALLMMSATLAACSKAPAESGETTETSVTEETTAETAGEAEAGGWTVNSEFGEAKIPEEAKAAFDKAMEGYTGMGFTPVAYLGSQVVAGANYAFLCEGTTMTAEPVTSLKIVTVYAGVDDTAEIKDVVDVNVAPSDDAEVEFVPSDFTGAYDYTEAAGAALPENVAEAFNKAVEGLAGVSYEPVALLGTQVVAGQNLAVLCKATSVTAEPATALAVVYVYADLEGGASVTGVNGIKF